MKNKSDESARFIKIKRVLSDLLLLREYGILIGIIMQSLH